ncbi:MAG: caspase family protein [Pseudomonadota bacterium]
MQHGRRKSRGTLIAVRQAARAWRAACGAATRLAMLALLCGLAGGAAARDHALLIGAADYDDPELRLAGPTNDVVLLWRVLVGRGVAPDAIRVLAHGPALAEAGIAPVGRARRAPILAEFARLAERVAPGDSVFIHLSGHGSQQPDGPDGDEPDGRDEIFLPEDVGRWHPDAPAGARVENAIIDDEIGAALSLIRARGAFVWFVMDSCHAGTSTRAADRLGIVARHVPPQNLGIDWASAKTDATADPAGRNPGTPDAVFEPMTQTTLLAEDGLAGLVAFYAASADEQALEAPMAPATGGAEEPPQVHGLLTYAMAEAMSALPDATHRDIALRIMGRYDSFRGITPTPVFEGPLDRPAPGAGPGPGQERMYPARRKPGRPAVTVLAGAFHGVTPDSRFVLTDAKGAPLPARIEIAAIGPDQTRLSVTAEPGGRVPLQMFARFEGPPRPATLQMGLLREPGTDPSRETLLRGVLARLDLPVQPDSAMPDLRLRLAGARLYLVPGFETNLPSEALPHFQPLSVPLDQPAAQIEADLAEAIDRFARAHSIADLAARLGTPARPDGLRLRAHVLAQTRDPETDRCPPKPAEGVVPPAARPVDAVAQPVLGDCDRILLELSNPGTHPIDVSGFYLTAKGDAVPIRLVQGGRRLAPGERLALPALTVSTHRYRDGRRPQPLPLGRQRIVFLAVERGPGADLSMTLGLDRLADPKADPTLPVPDLFSGDAEEDASPASAAIFRWIAQ